MSFNLGGNCHFSNIGSKVKVRDWMLDFKGIFASLKEHNNMEAQVERLEWRFPSMHICAYVPIQRHGYF